MAAKQQGKTLAIAKRREQVAELYLRGFSQCAIAEQLQVSQPTISLDIKSIHTEWKASAVRDHDALLEKELRKIDRLEREAWAAWERSQQPAQSARVSGSAGDGRSEKIVKNRYGDARFLDQVQKCIAQRCAILGLNAPIKAAIATISVDLTETQRRSRLTEMLTALRRRSESDSGSSEALPHDRELEPAGPTSPAVMVLETTAVPEPAVTDGP